HVQGVHPPVDARAQRRPAVTIPARDVAGRLASGGGEKTAGVERRAGSVVEYLQVPYPVVHTVADRPPQRAVPAGDAVGDDVAGVVKGAAGVEVRAGAIVE